MCNSQSYLLTLLNNTVSQSLRDNCDVQLLVDQSNPDKPDVPDIESVYKYVTTYASKRTMHRKDDRARRLQ